jgi:hypothetical protein
MNRTIKDATVKRYHYQSHDHLKHHLHTFLMACNFAKRLKTLKGLTPYEYICKTWTKESDRFNPNPFQHTVGLNKVAFVDAGILLLGQDGGRLASGRRRSIGNMAERKTHSPPFAPLCKSCRPARSFFAAPLHRRTAALWPWRPHTVFPISPRAQTRAIEQNGSIGSQVSKHCGRIDG